MSEFKAGDRIDKTPLQKHLDECAEVVKTWPKWKVESVRNAFGIPVVDKELGNNALPENLDEIQAEIVHWFNCEVKNG